MKRLLAFLLVLPLPAVCQSPPSSGQFQRIAYELSMPQPASHLFEVTVDLEVPPGPPPDYIDFQMPAWQPGRYAIADFAKNVQEFRAQSEDGSVRPLPHAKIDLQTWRVETLGSRNVTVNYKVFGNDLSGTFAQLDTGHANYNGGEIFMYIVGHKQDPVQLRIHPPPDWRVINGRTETPNQLEWTFPNYEILIDNPTEIGPNWTLDPFEVDGKTYRVVVHSRGNEGRRRPDLVRDLEKIVRAHVEMWGEPEFEHFTFLFHFANDGRSRDGMEHLTSAQIISPGVLAERRTYEDALGTASHEFFHAWNVKRLRPADLGPWNWTRPVNTRTLWIVEGITSYYGNMTLRRAGLEDDSSRLEGIAATITSVENSPGNRMMSAEQASMAAPFIDGAVHRQQTNLRNTSISYYTKGELIGLVLDLLIRGKTGGQRSLDDVMRRMYDEFYVRSPNSTYYLKGRGYTAEDFSRTVSEVAGTDMSGFFARHVRNTETLPYDEAFAYVGLRLIRTERNSRFTEYRLEEVPDAPAYSEARRTAWLVSPP